MQCEDTGRDLAERAARHDATVLFEPYYRHFFASAKRTRVYLEEVDSPRLRALLDPANLLELNDLNEMFDQLVSWIECLHAKDRRLHVDRGVPAGQGDLDYHEFVRLAAERTSHAPLILEYVGPDNFKRIPIKNESRTCPRPTSCCTTSTANPGSWSKASVRSEPEHGRRRRVVETDRRAITYRWRTISRN